MNAIEIVPWDKDDERTVIREPGAKGIKSSECAVVDYPAEKVQEVALISGLVRQYLSGFACEGFFRCMEIAQMAEAVLDYSPNQIAEARGQIEELADPDAEPVSLTNLEISYLDWYSRELWVERAREVDNPWCDKVELSAAEHGRDVLNSYLQRSRRHAAA